MEVGRRGLLAGLAAAVVPGRRRHRKENWPVGMQPDQNEFFYIVVISGGPGSGLFAYSPAPAAGTLTDSIQDTPGFVDGFGNAVLEDFAAYGSSGNKRIAANLTEGQLAFLSAPTEAGPWAIGASLAFTPAVSGTQAGFVTLAGPGTSVAWVFPSGDTNGADDFNAISQALAVAGLVMLGPGTFYLQGLITVAGATLAGCDMATVIRPNTTGAPYAGTLLAAGAKGVIRNLSVQNSGSDAITIAGGVSEWWLTDLYFASNAGNCINATITGPAHGRIRGIRGAGGGSANGGGIRLDGGTGAAVTAEVNVYDIDIQGVTATEVLFCSAVTDILVSKVNGSVKAGVATNAITVQGACQTVHLDGLDVGGSSAGTGVLVYQAAGGNSPTDCRASGKLQAGNRGLVVNDGTARCKFDVECTRNQLDGAQFNGTGAFNYLRLMANQNNLSAGTAYDANVTGSAHVLIDGPQWASPGVTANLNIALALNHVTVANPPASTTTAGNAPAGW